MLDKFVRIGTEYCIYDNDPDKARYRIKHQFEHEDRHIITMYEVMMFKLITVNHNPSISEQHYLTQRQMDRKIKLMGMLWNKIQIYNSLVERLPWCLQPIVEKRQVSGYIKTTLNQTKVKNLLPI